MPRTLTRLWPGDLGAYAESVELVTDLLDQAETELDLQKQREQLMRLGGWEEEMTEWESQRFRSICNVFHRRIHELTFGV